MVLVLIEILVKNKGLGDDRELDEKQGIRRFQRFSKKKTKDQEILEIKQKNKWLGDERVFIEKQDFRKKRGVEGDDRDSVEKKHGIRR